ncbi:MAG: S46 family peptidase [Gemmataceae bacterium]|nr:S46 family peptidase [Gemmataceae bacterium]
MNIRLFFVLLLGTLPLTTLLSDEGMWTFNAPPREVLKQRHQFEIADSWLEKARLASVRFNNGGSGSFVSPEGLILTNHHIGADALQKLSLSGRNLIRDGFLARSRAEELPCPDLELNVLMSIEDVTEKVRSSLAPGLSPAEAAAARRAAMAKIESDSLQASKLRSDVVTLYQGGAYHLYRYKKFTDVRLVMAPESGIASFGGDNDNFEFPRYCLDFCFFRAYENGQPVKPPSYFKLAATAPAEGDLVFVTGHPGTTNRLETLAKLIHRRDHFHPYTLARLRAMEAALERFSFALPENSTLAATDLHRVANARKAFTGQYNGLLNPAILRVKEQQEEGLKKAAQGNETALAAWRAIAIAQAKLGSFEKLHLLIERGDAFFSELFTIARTIVRLTEELPKPSGKRLREYRDSNLESLKFQLFSPAPIHPALEIAKLEASLAFLAEQLGGDNNITKIALGGETPPVRARDLVHQSKLADPAERKRLVEGGAQAIHASTDSMIRLARDIDEQARALRKRYEEEVEEPERQAYDAIAKVRFQLQGDKVAPDATFTLRLAFGLVKGYRVDDADLPFQTTFNGLYERHKKMQGKPPFELPQRWLEKKEKLKGNCPMVFVSTADTIGGNSGSPVINRHGELVGLNFDRNRHGLVRNFVYTEEQARHISVHAHGILEALETAYNAQTLAREFAGR